MFAFSRKGKKLGRVKVQLSDSAGTRSPVRQSKRTNNNHGDNATTVINDSDDNNHSLSTAPELENFTSSNSEGWKKLATTGDKPTPRFNHAAAVIGKKMIIVGGESGNGLLEDVQVLNFENYSWTTASSRLYLSPSSLQLKIPACKGHCLVPWGKKVLLVGGRTAPPTDRISVWAFETETECWSLMEAKGDIPVTRSGHTVVQAGSNLILFGGEDMKRRKLNDLHMFDLKSLTWLPLHSKGAGPSARCNHVAALYDDKLLFVFGGTSKSKSLNDLYSLDFETMTWSRIKIKGFHPSPRSGCCGVLCGTKWYIAGGGSRKKSSLCSNRVPIRMPNHEQCSHLANMGARHRSSQNYINEVLDPRADTAHTNGHPQTSGAQTRRTPTGVQPKMSAANSDSNTGSTPAVVAHATGLSHTSASTTQPTPSSTTMPLCTELFEPQVNRRCLP